MRNIIVTILLSFLLFTPLSGQDWISIVGKSPYPQGVKVFFEGYEGFNKIDVGSIRTGAGGEIDYFTDYRGFCKLKAEGMKTYALILEHDPVCLEWGKVPKFPCDPENEYFYGIMPKIFSLDSMYLAYRAENDSAERIRLFNELDAEFLNFSQELLDGEPLNANIFLQAEFVLRRTKMVADAEQMTGWKKHIFGFISDHYDILYHSDYIGKLAEAYVAMNNDVFKSDLSIQQAKEYDVDEWITHLGSRMGESEIVNFFLVHFISKGELEVASNLLVKYSDYVKCDLYVSENTRPASMPYSFNVFGGPEFSKVYSLDQFAGISKILVLFSTECPASIAAVTGLYSFMSEKQIRMPVIMAPNVQPEGELAELLAEKAPFGMQTGAKMGNAIANGAGVKQLPAFMILDRNNLLQEIIYDLDQLKGVIGGEE